MRALEANPKSVAAYQYLANAYIVELLAAGVKNLRLTSKICWRPGAWPPL